MRKITALLMSIILLSAMCLSVKAEESEVIYDGETISAAEGASLLDTVQGLQPGGEAEFSIKFTNDTDKNTYWYLSNEVKESLEDSGQAANGGYSYTLIYEAPDGSEEILFENGRIGGDESDLPSEDLKGLHQATNSMKDYFYLCELAAGESGRIIVRIGLDGESQPNSYKGTSGAVNVRFAVEDEAVTTPSTGDGSRMGLYIGIFSAALLIGVADIGYLIYSKKKEQAE